MATTTVTTLEMIRGNVNFGQDYIKRLTSLAKVFPLGAPLYNASN